MIDKETKTNNLTEEISFNVKQYGTGWYKVRAVAENGKIRNAWVKVSNVDKSLTIPDITIEPQAPNGEGSWYKRTVDKETEVETDTEVRVTISTSNNLAERIEYTAIRTI